MFFCILYYTYNILSILYYTYNALFYILLCRLPLFLYSFLLFMGIILYKIDILLSVQFSQLGRLYGTSSNRLFDSRQDTI